MKKGLFIVTGLLLLGNATFAQTMAWKNALLPKEAAGKPSTALLDEQGKPRYRIVVPQQATEKEIFAAKELVDRLNSFGPWTFETIDDSQPQNGPELRVGATKRSAKLADGAVGFDGVSIQAREDGSIELQGGRQRGLVNAVYAFLEEDLGYRYWDWQKERLPEAPLSFIPCSRTHTPPLEWREPFMAISFNSEWSLRNRTDSPNANVPKEAGGYYRMMGFAHTLPGLIPEDKYFKDHPEWFMMNNRGERNAWQHCETNPELAKELTRVLLAKIEKEGEPNIIHISKRDGGGTCHCPECKKVNEQEGTNMGSLLTLINRVAKVIGEKYPNIHIMTFAYLETEGVPKNMRPEPNVCIQYCNTKNAWSHCLTKAREDVRVVKDVSGWKPLCPIFVWDYSTNFDHYLIPLPNLAVIHDNIRFWIENNALGLMTQGAYHGNAPASERDRLRAWMISKLMWNPELDWKDLVRDFAVAYFGPAASPMLSYYFLLEGQNDVYAGTKEQDEMDIRYGFDAMFLTDGFLDAAEALAKQAHAMAGDDEELHRRIERDELPIIYARMGTMLKKGVDRGDFRQLKERLKSIADYNGMVTIAEKAQGQLSDFLALTIKPVNKSPEQVVFDIEGATVVRLAAAWKMKMISDSLKMDDELEKTAAALMGEQVDEAGWRDYDASLGTGWQEQGVEQEIGTGIFRAHFQLNAPKEHAHWYLVIPGIDEDGWVSLNGKAVAEKTQKSTGLSPEEIWNYPVVADITNSLRLGFAPNAIAVRVYNRAKMGGIYAGAYLVGADKALSPKEAYNLLPDSNPYGHSAAFK